MNNNDKQYYRILEGPFVPWKQGELVSKEEDGRIVLLLNVFGRPSNITFEPSQVLKIEEEKPVP